MTRCWFVLCAAACGGGAPKPTTPAATTIPAGPIPAATTPQPPPPTVGGSPTVVEGGGGTCGDLALYIADDSSAYMQRAYNGKPAGAVRGEADQWRDEAGHTHQDWYFIAPDRATLEGFVAEYTAAHPVPGDRKLAIEVLPGGARTYYLFAKAIVDGHAIAAASVGHDNVGRATVNVTLAADGAKLLEAETTHNIGRKLAIVVGGVVMSAPVIGAAIGGGKFSITVGGADVVKGDRDAQILAASLACK